jgi:hypothetical protein
MKLTIVTSGDRDDEPTSVPTTIAVVGTTRSPSADLHRLVLALKRAVRRGSRHDDAAAAGDQAAGRGAR